MGRVAPKLVRNSRKLQKLKIYSVTPKVGIRRTMRRLKMAKVILKVGGFCSHCQNFRSIELVFFVIKKLPQVGCGTIAPKHVTR